MTVVVAATELAADEKSYADGYAKFSTEKVHSLYRIQYKMQAMFYMTV